MNELALCSGNGGLSLGLRLAVPRTRTVCYLEREAFAVEDMARKMEAGWLDDAPVWSDLTTFDGGPWRGVVDIVSAGFPCQPFSCAGDRRGTDDERWLWPDIERIIGECEPGMVFLENVPGLVRHGLGPVLSGLARLGFDAEWDLFSAAQVGAPHLRKRVFILACHPNRVCEPIEPVDDEASGLPRNDAHPCRIEHKSNSEKEVADAAGERRGEGRPESEGEQGGRDASSGGPKVPDPNSARLTGHGFSTIRVEEEYRKTARLGWWESEPDVGRVADGVTDRVDRLRSIGNGVVPLVVAYAFRTLSSRMNVA